jgi:hypothetical protein
MSQRMGFAVTEIAIAIGVSTILLTTVVHGSGVLGSGRTARVLNDIQTLRAAVGTWVKAQGRISYAGLSVAALSAANVLTTSTVTTPWGGSVELSARTNDSYWIAMTGLPQSARDALTRHYQTQALQTTWDGTRFWIAVQ